MISKKNKSIKITLTPNDLKRLDELKHLTNINNKSILIRKAIKWYLGQPAFKKTKSKISEEEYRIAKINWLK